MPRPRKRVARAPAICVIPTKRSLYEILYRINEGFDQIVDQFQQLDTSSVRRRAWKRFRLIAEELRAEVNFELVGFLHERELENWTDFGRLRQKAEKRSCDERRPPARRK